MQAQQLADPSASTAALVVGAGATAFSAVDAAPSLTCAGGSILRDIEIFDQYEDHRRVQIPVERSLTVVFDSRTIGKLWTLGPQPEWLVLGYLRNRRLIDSVTEIESVAVEWDSETATVITRRTYPMDLRIIASSFHGEARAFAARRRLSRTTLLAILETMRGNDAIYRAAGSVQAAALFQGSELLLSVEDVSRRNCFDIITGWMALHGVPGDDKVLYSTGRLTAEVVMKAADNGVPTIVSRKGITSGCFDVATRLGMTLIGHAAPHRYICYAGAEFFDARS